MPDGLRWPYTEAHIAFERLGISRQDGTRIKGLSREDALDMREAFPGSVIERQVVVYVTGGPDKGSEVLGPWRPVGPGF